MHKMTIYSVMFIAFSVLTWSVQAQAAPPPLCPPASVVCSNPPFSKINTRPRCSDCSGGQDINDDSCHYGCGPAAPKNIRAGMKNIMNHGKLVNP